jgi:hypothetical protein
LRNSKEIFASRTIAPCIRGGVAVVVGIPVGGASLTHSFVGAVGNVKTSTVIEKRRHTYHRKDVWYSPKACGFVLANRCRTVFALIIINKAGGLIYNKVFHEAGLQTISTNDYLVLAGTFHG